MVLLLVTEYTLYACRYVSAWVDTLQDDKLSETFLFRGWGTQAVPRPEASINTCSRDGKKGG